MAGNDSWFRRSFRRAEAPKTGDATDTLSQLRASRPATEYATLFGAFRTAAPKTFRALCSVGLRSTSELVYLRGALAPVTLENELLWAAQWLPLHANRVNGFRTCANQVQAHVCEGRFEQAQALVDEHVRNSGWSLWAVELRAALVQLAKGTAEQRDWLRQLQAKTVNSIPGLLFEVIGDRNDDTYSYDAIYAKCMNSFPRFETVAPWLVDYLKFRALAHIDDPATALPNVMCRDITSSLLDYYEDVLEALTYVESETSLAALRPTACGLVSTLLSAGYKDHRLRKLGLALGVVELRDMDIKAQPNEAHRSIYLGAFEPRSASLPVAVASDLAKCEEVGAAAYELVGKLLKWGLNLRGLDVGPAVALTAMRSTSDAREQRVLPLSAYLLSEALCVDDAAALSQEKAMSVLRMHLEGCGVPVSDEQLFKPSHWNVEVALPYGGPALLWLGTQLLEREDYAELTQLLARVREKNSYWGRQAAKLDVCAAIRRGHVGQAVAELERWYRLNHLYAIEFPADALFSGRRWSDFKHLDPVLVGLVAHHEHATRGSANVGYICKMACRTFLQSGLRGRVVEEFGIASAERRDQLIAFLRDVWIEENLALCHQFESTAEVRVERMSVLQLLMTWESERAPEYAEAIKDLTFDQTLQSGLQRIDQTRVFVNESAITRWAEKELEQDYERWKRLTESSSGGRAVDDMLRQYALDTTNLELLKEFTNGKPTAADALLIDLIDRLYKRFLLDPTDGLDTYLSVRIRHGSLRGTILGPLEEQSLLYSTSGFSEQAFEARWGADLRLPLAEKAQLIALMQVFSRDIRSEVDAFVEHRVQVQRVDKPDGAFQQGLPPAFAKLIGATLAERPVSFHSFLCVGYFGFWKLVEFGLVGLRKQVDEHLAVALHDRIERLINDLRGLGARYLPLITTLTTASTMTKSQCDTVSEWFQLPSTAGAETYQLPSAIDIASVATRNVHRAFEAEVQVMSLPAISLPLTTSGLAVLTDCLFVLFENAWRHSGLSADLPAIELHTEYDATNRLLTLVCRSALSDGRRRELLDGELTRLRSKYLGELPLELISLEGGSGFPKLARLTRSVAPEVCPQAFDFGIEGESWFTSLTVPLYEREGAFETYE